MELLSRVQHTLHCPPHICAIKTCEQKLQGRGGIAEGGATERGELQGRGYRMRGATGEGGEGAREL